ncbi:MAG: four helix bundle protein [Clostridia bacterium]|nr:four helix bundle protein [Clostridia bacterium]
MTDYRVGDYKDLVVWKRGMEMAKSAYLLSHKLPREENYALADQIRRSSVSIPSNIAEGYGRSSSKDYARFLSMARGSSYELETQILLSIDLGYISENDAQNALAMCKEIARMLTRILQKLQDQ